MDGKRLKVDRLLTKLHRLRNDKATLDAENGENTGGRRGRGKAYEKDGDAHDGAEATVELRTRELEQFKEGKYISEDDFKKLALDIVKPAIQYYITQIEDEYISNMWKGYCAIQ
eukprot:8411532-Ditylum_brightwellii.AAC.2